MSSKVGICNSALIKLGASTIMSLADGSKNASLCNEQYDKLRDDLAAVEKSYNAEGRVLDPTVLESVVSFLRVHAH